MLATVACFLTALLLELFYFLTLDNVPCLAFFCFVTFRSKVAYLGKNQVTSGGKMKNTEGSKSRLFVPLRH
jgi:hypothetical protein